MPEETPKPDRTLGQKTLDSRRLWLSESLVRKAVQNDDPGESFLDFAVCGLVTCQSCITWKGQWLQEIWPSNREES